MRRPFSRWRRFLLALIALVASAIAFRGQIAEALVVRGDDFVYQGRSSEALARYARALTIDSDSSSAADRYVFTLMQLHTRSALIRGVLVATRYLLKHPNDGTLLEDRAICDLLLHRYAAARGDFTRSAQISSDAREYVFAGWSALHDGQLQAARNLWKRALQLDPSFRGASLALREHVR